MFVGRLRASGMAFYQAWCCTAPFFFCFSVCLYSTRKKVSLELLGAPEVLKRFGKTKGQKPPEERVMSS